MFKAVHILCRAQLLLLWRRGVVAAFCAIIGFASAALAQTPFYQAPSSVVAAAPGTLVRQEPIEGAPLGDPSDEEMAEIVKTQHRLRAERGKNARRP